MRPTPVHYTPAHDVPRDQMASFVARTPERLVAEARQFAAHAPLPSEPTGCAQVTTYCLD